MSSINNTEPLISGAFTAKSTEELFSWTNVSIGSVTAQGGGSVSVSSSNFRIARFQKVIFWQMELQNIAVTGSVNRMDISIASFFTASYVKASSGRAMGDVMAPVKNSSDAVVDLCYMYESSNELRIETDSNGNFPGTTNKIYAEGVIRLA